MQNENRCIICGEKKDGLPVREDQVIQLIRWFKKNVTKNEKGYRLVVCKTCYPVYAKSRKKFERRRALYIGIGVVFAALMFIASTNKALAIIYGIGVIVFVYLLSILTYMPALSIPQTASAVKTSRRASR